LVFVSGALTQEVDRVAEQVRAVWRNIPCCVVPAAGILSERGEVEGASAAAGILWRGGRVTPFVLGDGEASLRDVLAGAVGGKPATVVLSPRSDFAADMLEGLGAPLSPGVCVFGAGTVGGAAVGLNAAGEPLRGRVAGIAIHGLAPPLVE